jgi:hypothetical protein
MDVPNYTYLKLKMSGPNGVITVGPTYKHAFECDVECVEYAEALAESEALIADLESLFKEVPDVKRHAGNFEPAETVKSVPLDPSSDAFEQAKIASGRTMVPPDAFSRDLHQPSVKIDDTPEPEAPSAQPEVPLAQSEVPTFQPEVPSAPEGEALRVEEERSGVTPNRNWQTPYLQYLHRGELPLDRAKARWLARRAKSFVLLGDGKELHHRSPSGILQ